ncbi:hypothetical protein VTK56DRAFT_1044 [Thermocarpiscus australiensis]
MQARKPHLLTRKGDGWLLGLPASSPSLTLSTTLPVEPRHRTKQPRDAYQRLRAHTRPAESIEHSICADDDSQGPAGHCSMPTRGERLSSHPPRRLGSAHSGASTQCFRTPESLCDRCGSEMARSTEARRGKAGRGAAPRIQRCAPFLSFGSRGKQS